MKHILFLILFCTFASYTFSQENGDTLWADFESVDSVLTCPVLEFTDSSVKIFFDSVVQDENMSKYHNDSNVFCVSFRENKNIKALEMHIEVSDILFINERDSITLYGCIYYRNRLFIIKGGKASLFFKEIENTHRLHINCMIVRLFPIIMDPWYIWNFYYLNNNWFYFDYMKYKWMYYNYLERKWVELE